MLDEEDLSQLTGLAERNERSVAAEIRIAIRMHLNSNGVAANPAGAAATPSDSGG